MSSCMRLPVTPTMKTSKPFLRIWTAASGLGAAGALHQFAEFVDLPAALAADLALHLTQQPIRDAERIAHAH